MPETFTEPRWFDQITPVRELRGGVQGLAFKIMTGEEPRLTYGWQTTTCVDDYDDLNTVGKAAIRLAPTGLGTYLADVALHMPLERPTGLVTLAVAYLVVCWAVFVAYDPLCGLLEAARRLRP